MDNVVTCEAVDATTPGQEQVDKLAEVRERDPGTSLESDHRWGQERILVRVKGNGAMPQTGMHNMMHKVKPEKTN